MSLLAAVVVVAYKFNLLVFCTAGEQKPLVALPSSHHWEHLFCFFKGHYMKKNTTEFPRYDLFNEQELSIEFLSYIL